MFKKIPFLVLITLVSCTKKVSEDDNISRKHLPIVSHVITDETYVAESIALEETIQWSKKRYPLFFMSRK